VGKTEPQRVFEILGRTGEVEPSRLALRDRFAEGLLAYRQQAWAEAEAAFQACLDQTPDDGPARVFAKRVAHLAQNPPGPEWNGVWALTEK
jgi:hypothetical protein